MVGIKKEKDKFNIDPEEMTRVGVHLVTGLPGLILR